MRVINQYYSMPVLLLLIMLLIPRATFTSNNTTNVIKIGKYFWMSENLSVSCYSNGDSIPLISDAKEWSKTQKGARCYYDNNPDNKKYGMLYNWYAVIDPRGLAPKGFMIPTLDMWNDLIENCGGIDTAGTALKNVRTGLWGFRTPNPENYTGFNSVGAGWRSWYGEFGMIGVIEGYWALTKNKDSAYNVNLGCLRNSVFVENYYNANTGCSVRCVKM